MKKLALAALMIVGSFGLAQAQVFEQGSVNINAGVGLGSTFSSGLNTTLPPLGLSVDYGIAEKISLGAYGGFSSASADFYGGKYNYTYIILGARGAYHFTGLSDNFDPYIGLLLGYNVASVSYSGSYNAPSISAGGVLYAGYLGARYHFTENVGAFAELGYGIAYLQLGLTFKL